MMVDLVGSLIVWLRTQLSPAEVVTRVPRILPDKFVLVRRVGGPLDPPAMDRPTVTVEAWAGTQAAAYDLCQAVRARVWSLQGGTVNGIAVYRIEEFAGPAWLPDPDHDRARYVATFSIRHRETMSVA